MTLKEKLRQIIYPNHIHINEISDWTDSYTIEFTKWLKKSGFLIEFISGLKSTKELLKIFKKERGL